MAQQQDRPSLDDRFEKAAHELRALRAPPAEQRHPGQRHPGPQPPGPKAGTNRRKTLDIAAMAATAALCTSAAVIVALTGSDRDDTIDSLIIALMAVTIPYWGVQGVLAALRRLPHTGPSAKTVNFRDSAKLFLLSAAAGLMAISALDLGEPAKSPSILGPLMYAAVALANMALAMVVAQAIFKSKNPPAEAPR